MFTLASPSSASKNYPHYEKDTGVEGRSNLAYEAKFFAGGLQRDNVYLG
jgi:hypothetical protein